MAYNLNQDILKLFFNYLPQNYYGPIYYLQRFQNDIKNTHFKLYFEIIDEADAKFLIQSELKIQKLKLFIRSRHNFFHDRNQVLKKYVQIKELIINFMDSDPSIYLFVDTNEDLNRLQKNLLLSEKMPQLQKLTLWCLELNSIPNFANLTYLDCSRCQGFALLPLTLINLEFLNVTFTSVLGIPNTYVKLKYLDIQHTEILSLPNTLTNLKWLNISGCGDLMSLPETYFQLKTLIAYDSNLICLPDHSIKLIELETNNNNLIASLSDKYVGLKNISAVGNGIMSNNTFPFISTIENLDISHSPITKLPKFLTNLKKLRFDYCHLEDIPRECTKLEKIYALGTASIKKIPKELINIKYVDCYQKNFQTIKDAFEDKEIINHIIFDVI